MRGAGEIHTPANAMRRITPAYAGSSSSSLPGNGSATDHPRVCGEQSTATISSSYTKGSPPRMRGAVTEILGKKTDTRITPAYAGSSGSVCLE